jgi:hypothetical protein
VAEGVAGRRCGPAMAAPAHPEEIPRFIDTQIKPHLNKILRVLGNERPAAPVEFIMAGGDHKSHGVHRQMTGGLLLP